MLEINRRLNLNEPRNQKASSYFAVKKTMYEYLRVMKTACNNL